MKRFTLFIVAALIAAISFAQKPVPTGKALVTPTTAAKTLSNAIATVNASQRTLQGNFSGMKKAPKKAASDYEVITEQPAGTLVKYERTAGSYLYADGGKLYLGTQSGITNFVFADDGETVYIQNPVIDIDADTWVEGKLNSDGTKLTVAIPQNLLYVASYDACIAIGVNQPYNSHNADITEISYTVTENTITLDTYKTYSNGTVGAFWTDDNTIQSYGEYGTVFTKFVAPDVVEVPADLETEAWTFSAAIVGGSEDVPFKNTEARMGFVGNDVYLTGFTDAVDNAWAKGTKNEDGSITFATGQCVAVDADENYYYLVGWTNNVGADNMLFTFDGEATYTSTNFISVSTGGASAFNSSAYYRIGATISQVVDEVVEVPGDVEFVKWPFSATQYTSSGLITYSNPDAVLGFSGNDVYFKGFTTEIADAVIKGTVDAEGNLVFKTGQYIGEKEGNAYYFVVYNADAVTFEFDGELTYVSDNYISVNTAKSFNFNTYLSDGATLSQEIDELVTVPDGLETAVYTMKYKSSASAADRDTKRYVNVGFAGDDVYVQGVWNGLSDAWIKGTVDGNKITFAHKQYLGFYSTTYPTVYFMPFAVEGENENLQKTIEFTYDAEAKSFEATDNFAITVSKTELAYFQRSYAPLFKEFSANVTAKSAGNPGDSYFATFYDAEEGYVADDNTKVYTAKVSESGEWVDLAEVTNKTIPAGNAVILESNAENIQLAGVIGATGTLSNNDLKGAAADKAPAEGVTTYVLANGDAGVGFYKFAGATLAAGKAYIEIAGDAAAKVLTFGETTSINGVADVKAGNAVIYNLAGQRVNNAQKGVFIQNGKKVVF